MAKTLLHLPDLPNAGYATQREKELSDSVMLFMREIERDRIRLLTIVIEGRDKWRKIAGDIWRGLRIGENTQLLDDIYFYFTLQAVTPNQAIGLLAAKNNPSRIQDLMKIILPKLESQREQLKLIQKWS